MKLAGFGAGGHSKVLIDALRLRGADIVALTDSNHALFGKEVAGVKVVGNDDCWQQLLCDGITHAFIAVGGVGSTQLRRELFERAVAAGFEIVSVIHPAAIVALSAHLGRGVQILAGAIVNADATIGDNTIINTAAVVEHDCIIGSHAHVATGAKLASAVRVGDGSHIGIGASVRQCINIGTDAVIAAGAAVVKNVPDGIVVGGVPATALRV